jgi:hypothetical protein
VFISSTFSTRLGGPVAAARNVISGNTGDGVRLLDAQGNILQGNHIGVDASGTADLGNGGHGISLTIDSRQTTIMGNVIAFNGMDGIDASGGTGNAILANAIFNNDGLGIDQSNEGLTEGVTPNDPGEADAVQNFPVLTSAVISGGSTTITGSLQSTPNTAFQIRFFVSPTCDASGNGEGQTQIGTLDNVTTDLLGALTINVPFAVTLTEGHAVTATARNIATNDTSEFSACVLVTSPAPEPDALARMLGVEPGPGQGFRPMKGRLSLLKPPARVRDEPLLVALGLE